MKKIKLTLLMLLILKCIIAQDPGMNRTDFFANGTANPNYMLTGGNTCQILTIGEMSGNNPISFPAPAGVSPSWSFSVVRLSNVTVTEISGTNYWATPGAANTATSKKFYNSQTIPADGTSKYKICGTITATPGQEYGIQANIQPGFTNSGTNSPNNDDASENVLVTGVLPINLVTFEASVSNCNNVKLDWKSGLEENFIGYELQYSKDGTNYSTVQTIAAFGSNSNYTSIVRPDQGNAFYRLKMNDLNGQSTFSRVRMVNISCNGKGAVRVYPNPAKDLLKVDISGADALTTKATLFAADGKLVVAKEMKNGINTLNVNTLPTGMYLLKLTNVNGTEVIKVNKQ